MTATVSTVQVHGRSALISGATSASRGLRPCDGGGRRDRARRGTCALEVFCNRPAELEGRSMTVRGREHRLANAGCEPSLYGLAGLPALAQNAEQTGLAANTFTDALFDDLPSPP